MFLAADIGGTKTLIALGDQGGIRYQKRILNDEHPGAAALIGAFLREAAAAGLPAAFDGACLALAGPVEPGIGRARLTNRDWEIDAGQLARTLPLGPLTLLNDFAASAAGIATLDAEETRVLQAGEPRPGSPRLVLGPGTGLGVAAWLPGETEAGRILTSEAGHIGFAPTNREQRDLLAHLAARHGRVTVERIVSGSGLVLCHQFCTGGNPACTLTPAQISRRALAGDDAPSKHALDLFLAVFGAFAGDMALSFLARGGVFLAGGIVPKILPRLVDGPFLGAFNDKAEYAALAAAIPIVAVLSEDLALRGALATARHRAGASGPATEHAGGIVK